MIDALRASYREEAGDLLAQLETALLELESAPEDAELVGRVFRHMHTIKGSGAMFGLDRVASFTHAVETAFDLVRSGALRATPQLISLTLEARDHIKALLESEFGGPAADAAENARLLSAFRALTTAPASPQAEPQEEVAPVAPAAAPRASRHYRIRFRPAADILRRGTNPLPLLAELRGLGECTVTAQTHDIPELADFDAERCYVFWDILLTTSADENAIRDIFIFVEGECELKIERIEAGASPKIGEILTAKGDAAAADVESALKEQKRLGEILVGGSLAKPDAVRSALAEQEHLKQRARAAPNAAASIRVAAEKLDTLMNTVGEMVTAQARLTQLAARSGDPELDFAVEEMERLTDRLRADTMSVRMLPIGSAFARFSRLTRDLCRDLGKQVELVTEGGEAELDKNMIEQLNDPLVHLIRNCLDHGIEGPADREALGKPACGTVRLSAAPSGAHMLIRVTDDGAGLDTDRILAKGIEKGLVPPGSKLSDNEIHDLIFHPGFSTAKQITEISGRGVGLDVVRRGLAALRGSVEVRSVKDKGSTFTLKVPLTLAITDGLLVSVGEDFFVMPVASVIECVELSRGARSRRGRTVVVRDELVPYVSLREHFAISGDRPDIEHVMLAETESGKFGFLVDRVIGDHQTVIKSLGQIYQNVETVSGAAILGDGAVALILDLDKLAKDAARLAA